MSSSKLIQRHPFHLVDTSPWPFVTSISALTTATGFVMYMHSYQFGAYCFILGLLSLFSTVYFWWRDVVRESTYQGHHTKTVQVGLRWGMIDKIDRIDKIGKIGKIEENSAKFADCLY